MASGIRSSLACIASRTRSCFQRLIRFNLSGVHLGLRDQVLSSLPDVFDFARFSYISVIAEDGRVDAVINQGVKGTDAVIKIVDCWTVRDGKVTSIWVAYFEPQALLEKLGIAHGLGH